MATATKAPRPTLDQLAAAWTAFDDLFQATGGEIPPEREAEFAQLVLDEQSKVDGYAFRCKGLKADEAKWKGLAAEASQKAASLAKQREWLMERVGAYIDAHGTAEPQPDGSLRRLVRGEFFRFQWEGNGGKVPVEVAAPVDQVPARFLKVWEPPPPEVDTEKLRLALEAGDKEARKIARLTPRFHVAIR